MDNDFKLKITYDCAKEKWCPFKNDVCVTLGCMAFIKIENEIIREDHSGGKQMINEAAIKRGQPLSDIKRIGRDGSEGLYILPALYTCLRLK